MTNKYTQRWGDKYDRRMKLAGDAWREAHLPEISDETSDETLDIEPGKAHT